MSKDTDCDPLALVAPLEPPAPVKEIEWHRNFHVRRSTQ